MMLDRACSLEAALPDDSPLRTCGALPLAGRRVIELGSGSGVAGMAAAALGAHVTLTDLPDALPLLQRNAQLNEAAINQKQGSVRVLPLEWEKPEQLPPDADECDLVLGADLVYQREGRQLDALCQALHTLFARTTRPCVLLLAHKARHAALDTALAEALRERAGLTLTEIPRQDHHQEFCSPSIKCFVGHRAAAAAVSPGSRPPDKRQRSLK